MEKVSCSVIRDLLPLYEDNAASGDTADLVRKHLAGCPECREVLQRMRTPISVPPEDDQEMLVKFRARREELRRKRRNILIAAAFAVLAAAALCLWYARPRSWDSLTKSRSVSNMAASLSDYYFRISGENIDHGWDIWSMDADQADGPALEAVLRALKGSAYRASFRNLIPKDVFSLENVQSFADLVFVWEDPDWGSVRVYDDGRVVLSGWMTGYSNHLYYSDSALYQRLAPIIQEYGTFQNE